MVPSVIMNFNKHLSFSCLLYALNTLKMPCDSLVLQTSMFYLIIWGFFCTNMSVYNKTMLTN